MRIYMQQPPQKDIAPRYVQLMLEQDLLGGWTLYRESGNQGGRVTLRRQVFIERDMPSTHSSMRAICKSKKASRS